jgi:hypothetical protein
MSKKTKSGSFPVGFLAVPVFLLAVIVLIIYPFSHGGRIACVLSLAATMEDVVQELLLT